MSAARGSADVACPGRAALEAFAALELPDADEAAIRTHLRTCAACSDVLLASEPLFRFSSLPARTLPAPRWDDVMRAVRAEAIANPRGADPTGGLDRLRAWLARPRLSPWLAAAAALGFVALTAGHLRAPDTRHPEHETVLRDPPPEPQRESPLEIEGLLAGAAAPSGFVYLSNPDARVASLLVGGDAGTDPIQVTVVIDENLADLF